MHYRLTSNTVVTNTGVTLYQIEATTQGYWGPVGTLGGYIQSERNLSGNAWVHHSARVYDNAQVYDNALVYGSA